MLVYFSPGPWELIILFTIVALLFAPIVIAVVLLIGVLSKRKTPENNPNLVSCPDCGQLVSLSAAACPQCGRPFQSQQ